MAKKFGIQVERKHYYKDYDDLIRFISYFYQIDLTKKLRPKKVLEIGVGNKTVSNYLKQHGFDVTTCDFDKKLRPDYVADIRDLPFKDNSYDVVLACEILEHLPWKDVDRALKELHRVTKKNVVTSIPYPSLSFEFLFKFPLIGRVLEKPFADIFLRIPYSFPNIKFGGEHYWEIGRKNYSIRKVRKLLKKRFRIIREVRPVLDSYHHFFVLGKN